MDDQEEWNSKNITFLYAVEMQAHFDKLVVETILKWFYNEQYHNWSIPQIIFFSLFFALFV